ncbi:hypothetical protein RO3G_13947 [Rhizopus delemar RA 99-880]|uniref:Uncharacterized protein n=1 Tax=Rhizopus delemar (strain RA 99-880 / ATCC MYA-4621 / FGSC 9543 / NRRL 43880) TaxID=246409 RepID=I1CLA6_RHIO9|nr:hypothetical protein RO3G_13947 [Rhizopus delemar RA 99-880]|eukprot:EIE89236.1 hypothetical protein RO3G_13947 [Rhizopus delemar RA 99-880]
MSPCGNDLPGSRRPQTPHLVCLDAPHLQPFPPFLVAKPKRDVSQPSPTAIARQLPSPAEPTDFKRIHVAARHFLSLQPMRSNLRRLHINIRRILDIHYSDRNLVGFIHN